VSSTRAAISAAFVRFVTCCMTPSSRCRSGAIFARKTYFGRAINRSGSRGLEIREHVQLRSQCHDRDSHFSQVSPNIWPAQQKNDSPAARAFQPSTSMCGRPAKKSPLKSFFSVKSSADDAHQIHRSEKNLPPTKNTSPAPTPQRAVLCHFSVRALERVEGDGANHD